MPDSSGSPEHVRIGPASRPTGGTKWTCPHTTSPKAEPPKGALGPRAGRRRLGPRTPPSVPRRAAPDRHLESPKPPPRPSNTPFRGAGPPLVSNSPQRALISIPRQGPLSRLTGQALLPYRGRSQDSRLALPGKVPKGRTHTSPDRDTLSPHRGRSPLSPYRASSLALPGKVPKIGSRGRSPRDPARAPMGIQRREPEELRQAA